MVTVQEQRTVHRRAPLASAKEMVNCRATTRSTAFSIEPEEASGTIA
jgi:hypothetical protein